MQLNIFIEFGFGQQNLKVTRYKQKQNRNKMGITF